MIGGTKTMHLICLFTTVCSANFAVAWTIPMDHFCQNCQSNWPIKLINYHRLLAHWWSLCVSECYSKNNITRLMCVAGECRRHSLMTCGADFRHTLAVRFCLAYHPLTTHHCTLIARNWLCCRSCMASITPSWWVSMATTTFTGKTLTSKRSTMNWLTFRIGEYWIFCD